MKHFILILAFAVTANMAWAQKTGIGTTSPTTRLHVKDTSDPLRLEGLQDGATTTGTTAKTLVADADGVLKTKSRTNVSAVRVFGNVTLALNNTQYFNDASAAPTESFDHLNEFSGHTFTAREDGIYRVSFVVRFDAANNLNYYGYAGLFVGNGPTPPQYGNWEVTVIPWLGASINQTLVKTDLVKLTAGQLIQFKVVDYNAGANRAATYMISINRID